MSKPLLSPEGKIFAIVFGFVVIVIIIGAGVVLTSPQPIKFDNYGQAPNFTLLNQDNKTVTLDTYNGIDVLIVNFIYTHCPDYENGTLGTCSLETAKMNTVMGSLINKGYNNTQFHIISISFDYLFDNVSTMKAYGLERGEGKFDYWSFLTGNKEQTQNVTQAYGVYAEYFNDTENTTTTTAAAANAYSLVNTNTDLGKIQSLAHNDTNGWSHTSVVWVIDKNRDKRQYHTGTDWLSSDVVKEVEQLIHTDES